MIKATPAAIVIGASAGGGDALFNILPVLPEDYPLPIIVVLHLPPDKESLLAELFGQRSRMAVAEAEDKLPLAPGTIYFAPPNYHLLVERDMTLSLSNEEAVLFSRPSIDVLFESAAEAFGPRLMGIVLTGGNEDGAAGLKAIVARGGQAVVQDPAEAAVPVMPAAVLRACPAAEVLPLDGITKLLQNVGERI